MNSGQSVSSPWRGRVSAVVAEARRRSHYFDLPTGPCMEPGSVRGYYIDLTSKAEVPAWPPPWFPWPGYHRFIATAQWTLGAYDRYLQTGGAEWLAVVDSAGRYILGEQEPSGAWSEEYDYPHTFHIKGPWRSAMAQGQCASVLVRLFLETGEEAFAEAARRALQPMRVDTGEGGVCAWLDGDPFPEEYPTTPPSFVLNGSMFAAWGMYDVWKGLADEKAGEDFRTFTAMFARNLWRWDLGFWTRYDLYPHPVVNIASGPYHRLHTNQLRALQAIAPRPEFADALARFEVYAASARGRAVATTRKVAFRLVLPRNRFIRGKMPWDHAQKSQ